MGRIRFTLVVDGEDVRSFDFTTEVVQIGADPTRGDTLTLDLPQGLRHVRARAVRTDDYVEFEVLGGPIWLHDARLEEGDVAELNVGDVLTFGSRKRGAVLRFETATEEAIVLDDVADWSIAPKKRTRASADDAIAFEEEVDPYEGLNVWQRYLVWYRQKYAGFAKWRKKAARIKYWWNLAAMIVGKLKGFAGIGLAIGAGVLTNYVQYTDKLKAIDEAEVAQEAVELSANTERDAHTTIAELRERLDHCDCPDPDSDDREREAAVVLLDRFGDLDPDLVPERDVLWIDKTQNSYASLVKDDWYAFGEDRTLLPRVVDRVCSASGDKERMNLAVREAGRHGLHESYLFVPFVESYWCELAVSPTGPRGMMQFTRATAQAAFAKVDPSQARIPNYDFREHRAWLSAYADGQGVGINRLLAECRSTLRRDYQQHFYNGETDPQHPLRVDPDDPRTDWKIATEAAFSWIASLDQHYAGRGWRGIDVPLLAMSAYNQGQGEVDVWIRLAQEHYGVANEANLTFPQVLGGSVLRERGVEDPEKTRQIREGRRYAAKIVGSYLATAPQLDERGCRN